HPPGIKVGFDAVTGKRLIYELCQTYHLYFRLLFRPSAPRTAPTPIARNLQAQELRPTLVSRSSNSLGWQQYSSRLWLSRENHYILYLFAINGVDPGLRPEIHNWRWGFPKLLPEREMRDGGEAVPAVRDQRQASPRRPVPSAHRHPQKFCAAQPGGCRPTIPPGS